MDGLPLGRGVVLVELLYELRVHDLSQLLAVVHDREVGLVFLPVATVQIVFIVAGADPKVPVEVGLKRYHRLQQQYKPKVDFSVETLNGIADVLLDQLGPSFHVSDEDGEVI